jgi:hypothetical protein
VWQAGVGQASRVSTRTRTVDGTTGD